MADLFSPAKFDADTCRIKTAGTGDAIDPKHILVDPDSDNVLTNDPQTGLKVVAEDFISAEEGNLAKPSQADGGVLVKASDMVSDAECNALSVTQDGKLALIPEDLISDVNGGNPLGINPDDCKLFINPCLLPGPQNIVSNDEGNLIVRDPDDCSALLKYNNVVSEDSGNLIQPGSDGKLNVNMQYMVDRGYYGAGLVYVEKQDGSHSLQVAACDGLKFEEGDVTDTYGNTYHAKWLVVNLDQSQNVLYFKDADGCVECFTDCKQLSLEFSLNANGTKLRILDHNGDVYRQINLSNGLEGDGSGGLTINTLDTLSTTAPTNDLPVSSKAVKAALDDLWALCQATFPPKDHASTATTYGLGNGTKYGHLKLSAATDSTLGVNDGTAATPSAVKAAYDAGTRQGTGSQFGQVKLTDSLKDGTHCASSGIALSACAGKALQDQIDDLKGGDDDGTGGIIQHLPLYATAFDGEVDNNTSNYIRAKLVVPKKSGKKFTAFVYPISASPYSNDDPTISYWNGTAVPVVSNDVSSGGQVSTVNGYFDLTSGGGAISSPLCFVDGHSIIGYGSAGVFMNMVTYSASQISDIVAALNALAPIPLNVLAKFTNSQGYYFSIWRYNLSSFGIQQLMYTCKRACLYQLLSSYAIMQVTPEVNVSTLL